MKQSIILSIYFFLLAVILPICAYGTPLDRTEISDLYSQAKSYFRKGNELSARDPASAYQMYEKAVMRYERIINQGGIQNGKIYYNLGNIYFRMKNLGYAILNYKRAMQYIPNDVNLKQNLSFARQMRLDKIEEKQKTKVFKTLFFWHYDFSLGLRVIMFTITFILIWVFALIRIYLYRNYLNWVIIVLVVLSAMMAGSLIAETITLHQVRPGVIIDDQVIARKGNSETYEVSFKEPLHAGTEFNLVENRDSWYFIELLDARRCWVPAKTVALVR